MTLPTCECGASEVAYTVTAADLPELSPEEAAAFVDYPVYSQCTAHVNKGRTFAPGHDAKLKSVLIRAFRGGYEYAHLEGALLITVDPMNVAKERGWSHFLTAKPARKSRKATKASKGPETEGQAEPTSNEPVAGFRPCQVKVGRWWKDGQVVSFPDDEHVTVVYNDSKGEAKTITVEKDKVKEG